jgi:hypothetical protein
MDNKGGMAVVLNIDTNLADFATALHQVENHRFAPEQGTK